VLSLPEGCRLFAMISILLLCCLGINAQLHSRQHNHGHASWRVCPEELRGVLGTRL